MGTVSEYHHAVMEPVLRGINGCTGVVARKISLIKNITTTVPVKKWQRNGRGCRNYMDG
jgi:hypothetical protein